ncbi:BZ3500_MvSof-1268-A1-R1_Chr1-3g02434 [Microbotryum saponariae]|uniref:BZ3500_MvSof-1268-A1-R1_Chr1-3g02434 protein n=1 Tax=Microbotryum saponariae TaxID=289078 RepID=A0A2X0LBB5_9BASI|nr:BZ3500_MvSof-1268-A1-R1_Chr1-3g02434 [Microbotryum saponariae]SCZ96221.1 BZ3501_MvSof-1269-A2-R1_Chr1-3g02037 [Microbotryum saponariae]
MADSSNPLHLARSTSSAAPVAPPATASSPPCTGLDSTTLKLKSTQSARRRKPAAKVNPDQAGASTSPSTSTSTPIPGERPPEHETKENTPTPSVPKRKPRKKSNKVRESPVLVVATPSRSTLADKADSVIPPPPPLTPSWDDQLVASISAQASLAVDHSPTLQFEKLSLDQLEATPTLEQIVAAEAHVAQGEGKVLSKKAQRDLQLKLREPQGYERMMELRKQKRKERNKKRKEGLTKGEQPSEKKEFRIKGSAAFVTAVGLDEPEVTERSAVDETSTQVERVVPKVLAPVQTEGPTPVSASASTTAPSIPTGPAAYRNAPPVRNQPSRQQGQSLIRAGPRIGISSAPVPGSINPRFAHLPFHPHYRYPMPKTASNAPVTPVSKSATPLASSTNKKSPTTAPTPMPTTRPAAVEDRLFGEGRAQSVVRLPSSSSLPVVVKVPKPTTPTPTPTSDSVEVSTPAVPISQSTSQEPLSTPTPTPTSVPVSLPTQAAAPEPPASIVAPPPQYSAIPTHPVLRNIPPHIQRLTTPPSAPLSPIAVAPLPSHFYPQPQPSLYLPYYPHQPTPTTYYGSTTSNEGYSPILSHGTTTPPPPHHQHMITEAGRPSPLSAPARHSKALDIKAPPANYSVTRSGASVGQDDLPVFLLKGIKSFTRDDVDVPYSELRE